MRLKKLMSSFLIVCMLVTILPVGILNVYAYESAKPYDISQCKTQIDKIITIASSQVGYHGPNDDSVYGAYYGCNGQEWCAAFVSWCAAKAGISDNIIPKYVNCDYLLEWYTNNGCWKGKENPKRGDIVLFDYTPSIPGPSHVGIVEKVDNGTLHYIHGNTGENSSAGEDRVANAQCSLTYGNIYGYASPKYQSISQDITKADIQAKLVSLLYNNNGGILSCDFDGYVELRNKYGYRHEGIDFANYKGASVYSLINGKVLRTGGSLNTIAIYDEVNNKTVVYMHVDNIKVSAGNTVQKGTLIATESNKGTSSVHTHVEVVNGQSSYANVSSDKTLANSDPYPYWKTVLFENSASTISPTTQVITPTVNTVVKNDYPMPVTCYTLKTSNVTTYYGDSLSAGTGYIDGYNDQCVIKAVVKINGKDYARVTYPGVRGYAYVSINEFINANIERFISKTKSNQTVYRRSNLSQSIGTVYSTDTITVVSQSGNNVQIIYPVSGGYKMGWISKSALGSSVGPSYTLANGPIKAYTKSTGRVTTYSDFGNTVTGYIDGAVDLCTINEVYTNGWCSVTYPTSKGAKTAYTQSSNFADSFNVTSTTNMGSNRAVYRRPNLKESLGTIYANDLVKVVGSANGNMQVIYPLDSGGYKMGWISGSYIKPVVNKLEIKQEPITNKVVVGQPVNTNGLSVVANYIGGFFKSIGKKLGILEDGTEGYELSNTTVEEVGINTIVVSYEENGVFVTDSFNIEGIEREAVSLNVTKTPNKTTYIEGELFDITGIEVTAKFNNGETENVSEYEFEIPDMTPGTKTIYLYFEGVQTSFNITVKEKLLESIKLKTLPNKTTYAEGQSLDSTGLRLIASYNNGTTEEITSGFECSAINSSYIGKQNVTVTYKGKTATFPITVIEKKPSGIEIVSNPTKTDLLEGIIDLDTTGMKVKISYDNGSSETIETGFNLVGYEPRTLGKQTITANYCGFTDTFDINVKAKSLTELKIAEPASVTEFIEGQDFASYGLVVHGYYDNGDINEISDYTISGYDNTIGTKTITIAYGGKTVSYDVTVSAKTLECIDIESLPTKTEYLEDEELDTTGLSVAAVYNNGDREAIALSDLEITGYDNAPGTKGINVSYGDYSTVFDVTVKEMTLTSFTLDTKPTKTEYNVGEELDLAGLSMTAKYEHGRTETVDIDDCAISGFDKDKAGIQVVVISYRGSNVAFVVNVKQIIEQTAMIRTKNVSAVNGSTIAVPVNIINNTGISNLELNVSYDKNVLTNADIKASELLGSGTFNVAVSEETDDFITQTIAWSADSDMAKNGTIFTAYFTVSNDAVAGNYPIEVTYNAETPKNKAGKAVKLSCVDGSVDVVEGETIPYVISGEQATVQSGGLLNYEISLANNVGLSSYKLQVLYDTSALDINAVKSGRLFGDFTVDYTEIDGGIEITGTSEELNKQSGSFLTLEFSAAEGIENATYPISITCTENGNDATIECEEGSVAISGYVLGDINGDGRVNNFDVMMHVGYLSGGQKLTPEQLMAADVTGDGNVDYLDYSSISSYVVGIYEGLNSDVETVGSSLKYGSTLVGGANTEKAIISASEIEGAEPGDYVTVDVDLYKNPGLSGYVVTMEYDAESLELIDIVQKDALSGGKFNTNTSVEGEATVMWSDSESRNDNGTIFSITFKLGNDVPEELPLIITYNSEHTGYLDETNSSVPVSLMSMDGVIYIDTESAYMTLDEVVNDGTDISGTINIYNDAEFEGIADLFVATYDEKGKLVSIESQDVELTANETSTPNILISAKDAKALKVFVFEKGSIRPLMKSKSKTF